jgi:hypothetical protein
MSFIVHLPYEMTVYDGTHPNTAWSTYSYIRQSEAKNSSWASSEALSVNPNS